ncbi:MAG TPA: hypothetical protein VEL76_33440 [Gemmataceae bacterium]|nr:hypothetical protein [Gemmataceae bacterium]
MRRHRAQPWAFVVLLAATNLVIGGPGDQSKAVAAVKALGGEVHTKDGGIVGVSWGGCAITDADLAHLKALTGLQTLDL